MLSPALRWMMRLLAATLLVGGATRLAATEKVIVAIARIKEGDDFRWASREWDDRDWKSAAMMGPRFGNGSLSAYSTTDLVPARTGIHWVRVHVQVPERTDSAPASEASARQRPDTFRWPADEPNAPQNGMFFGVPCSFELFWDGERLAQGGVVGKDRDSEIPGPLDFAVLIPDRLRAPGEHVLAYRISSWHYNFPANSFSLGLTAGNFTEILMFEMRRPIFPVIASASALFMAAICGFLFSWIERRRPVLLCGLLSLATATYYALISFRWLLPLDYTWFCPRLVAITVTMTIIAVLMPWLLLELFQVPRKRWWLATLPPLLAVAWTISPIYEIIVLWLCRAMLLVSIAIIAWAARKKPQGSQPLIAGLLICLLTVQTSHRDFINVAFFLMFNVLVLFLLAQVGIQIRDARSQTAQAKLTAARLEIELLKKNLQPHFLMNTLTALMEVIEQSPATAVRLIDDLSREFRLLTAMSAEKTVSLEQELELCRAHLRVVSIRSAVEYRLDVEGFDASASVPPALFLTLIENAFSHQRLTGRDAVFTLRCERTANRQRHLFLSPGEVESHPTRSPGGTGLRYVRARLEESFPGKWSLTQGAVEEGWRTVIDIQGSVDPL